MVQQSNSVSVGSRVTLISLMDKDIQKLPDVKTCSRNPNPRASTIVPPSTSTSTSSSSSSSLHVLRSSALWNDVKGFLKSSTTSHYAPAILFCKDEVNPRHGVQEACHIRAPRAKEAQGSHNFSKQRALKQRQGVNQQKLGEGRQGARKNSQRRNTKPQRDGYHSDDQKQSTVDSYGDHGLILKPMLGKHDQHQHKNPESKEHSKDDQKQSTIDGYGDDQKQSTMDSYGDHGLILMPMLGKHDQHQHKYRRGGSESPRDNKNPDSKELSQDDQKQSTMDSYGDDEKQSTMDSYGDDHGFMVKPMLGKHHHHQQHQHKNTASDQNKKLSHKTQKEPVDLQCCYSYHPLSKRLGFTRLSNL